MSSLRLPPALAAALAACAPAPHRSDDPLPTAPDLIPFQKHVLANGLEVILHEDHSDPVVAVYLYYHVGSSREEPGRSGFAHLFEHMLFQGSEHVGDNEHFRRIQEAGGTLNGSTNQDRTNYFETLPSNQLELALWLESDRMGFLLPAMDQEKLDNQREVVKNERRQSYENRPYGLVQETLLASLYPDAHPYHWPTIGSMADLEAARLEDVAAFFRRWYGPNNATLAIGGDIDPAQALALVERYFGALPRGADVPRPSPRPAPLDGPRRAVTEDDVKLPQLTLTWPTVPAGAPDEAALNLLADVLSANRSSLLDRALLEQEELASLVTVSHQASELAGSFSITLRPRPGVSLDRLEARVDELVRGLAEQGVDPARLARLQTRREGILVRALETVSGRTDRLARDNCFFADPGRARIELARLRAVRPEDVRAAARRYLVDQPRLALSVVPEGQLELAASGAGALPASTSTSFAAVPPPAPTPVACAKSDVARAQTDPGLDRTHAPAPAPERPLPTFATFEEVLANGVRLLGTPFDKVPLARFSIAVPAGRLRQPAELSGLAELTARMLEEGTRSLSGSELVDELDGLGGDLSVTAGDDEIVVRFTCLAAHAPRAAQLARDLLLEPRLASADFERVRRQLEVEIESRADDARAVAGDVFRRLVHGEGAAGAPELGTREGVLRTTLEDVRASWSSSLRPGLVRVSYVGPGTEGEVRALFAPLAELPAAQAGERSGSAPAVREHGARLFLVDKPGAAQSELRIGHVAVPRGDAAFQPLQALNQVLGGSFTSRINLNLREDKGYTYGARSAFEGGAELGTFVVSAAVHTAVTADAVREALRELDLIVAGVRDEELEFARASLSQSLRRSYESTPSRLALLEAIGKYGPAERPERRLAGILGLSRPDLDRLAQAHVHPGDALVLVVGDASLVREKLAALGLGEVVLLDRAGAPTN